MTRLRPGQTAGHTDPPEPLPRMEHDDDTRLDAFGAYGLYPDLLGRRWMAIIHIEERRQVRLVAHHEEWEEFIAALKVGVGEGRALNATIFGDSVPHTDAAEPLKPQRWLTSEQRCDIVRGRLAELRVAPFRVLAHRTASRWTEPGVVLDRGQTRQALQSLVDRGEVVTYFAPRWSNSHRWPKAKRPMRVYALTGTSLESGERGR